MKTSAAGRAAIAQREGNKLKAYRDTKGIWTIGVGHTAAAGAPAPKAGMTITAAQSDEILARDLADVEAAVNSAVKVKVTQNQFDAMVSLAFNIGNGSFKKSTVVKRLNAGDVAGAGAAFMLWNKPPEIIGRRKTEQAQFLKGSKTPAAPKPPAKPATPPAVQPVAADPVPVVPDPPTKETIAGVQQRLKDLGYNPGSPDPVKGWDGIAGPLTRGSILSFKNDNGLTPNDTIDEAFLTALATASPRKMPDARANATVSEVAAKVPEAGVHWWNRLGAAIVGGGTTIAGAADYIAPATGYLQPAKDFVGDLPTYVWVGGVVVLCAALFVASQYGAKKAQAAFQAGDRR